jgi:hypothetical protein
MTKGQELALQKKENKKLFEANKKLQADYEKEKNRANHWHNLYLHLASDRANEIKKKQQEEKQKAYKPEIKHGKYPFSEQSLVDVGETEWDKRKAQKKAVGK